MKRLIAASIPILFLTGCLNDITSGILYPYSSANQYKVPATAPAPLQKIDISTGTAETVGWYYAAANPNAPVLIYFHGNGDNIESLLEGKFLDVLKSFGVNFAVFDYPLYGLSKGELDEKGVLAAGQSVINFMKQRFPKSPLILWGQSLGTASATILTSTNQDSVIKLILTSPWDEFWRVVQSKVSSLNEASCKDAATGNEYLQDVASQSITIPVLIHHGTKDGTVPFVLGQHLSTTFANGSKNVTFVPLQGLDHNNVLTGAVLNQINQFIHQ